MSGLFRFLAKLIGRDRSRAAPNTIARKTNVPSPRRTAEGEYFSPDAQSSEALGPGAHPAGPESSPPLPPLPRLTVQPAEPIPYQGPDPSPDPSIVFLDLADDEEFAEDPEDETTELDPTIGRYEELHVPVLDADEIGAQRAAAEVEGLSGPHKIFPHDPAGPGSLAETLARLESEGRVTSRICDDAEEGFFVLYEPHSLA